MCDLKHIGADGIFRGHAQRHYDFRSGIRLGKNDHVVNWKKPNRPEWMTQEKYDAYPAEMQVREFKVNGNVYVTTFLHARKYHKQELAKIYERRWDVEMFQSYCLHKNIVVFNLPLLPALDRSIPSVDYAKFAIA